LKDKKKRVYQATDFVAEGNDERRGEAWSSSLVRIYKPSPRNAVERRDMVNKLTLIRKSADEVYSLERLEEFITVVVDDSLRNRQRSVLVL
jgi:hypothetical protein